ncbi:MAG: Ig-like domain-containing protein [Spirochaetota bacterium]
MRILLFILVFTVQCVPEIDESIRDFFIWEYLTRDRDAIKITNIAPEFNSTGVPTNKKLVTYFNKELDQNQSFLTLNGEGKGTTFSANSMLSNPGTLEANTEYTVYIFAKASANNSTTSFLYTFTTGSSADQTAPSLQLSHPNNSSSDTFSREISSEESIVLEFDEDIDPTDYTIILKDADGNPINTTVYMYGSVVIINNITYLNDGDYTVEYSVKDTTSNGVNTSGSLAVKVNNAKEKSSLIVETQYPTPDSTVSTSYTSITANHYINPVNFAFDMVNTAGVNDYRGKTILFNASSISDQEYTSGYFLENLFDTESNVSGSWAWNYSTPSGTGTSTSTDTNGTTLCVWDSSTMDSSCVFAP